jgi:GMP synthase (glutamine-hydrolysing)
MTSLLVLQHAPCEHPGAIADALPGIALHTIRADLGHPVPKELGNADGLIVMGGPQSVYEQDKFPHLRDELHLIEDALRREKPILGVCLGSQLLAAALGARVYPGKQKEIGWFDVTLCDDPLWGNAPRQFTALHWHGDVFDLPRGAKLLASSALTPHQAYRYGKNACALLFHLEMTAPQIAEMVTLFADELHQAGSDARAILTGAKKHLPTLRPIAATVFSAWKDLL